MEGNSFTILAQDAGSLTCANKPSEASIAGGYGVLTVQHGVYANQLFFPYTNDGNIYTRSKDYYNGAPNWREWYKLYHSGNSNKSDVAWACSNLEASGVIHATTGIWTDGYFSGRGLVQTSDERDKGGWRGITFTLADIVNAPAGSFAWLNAPGRSAGTTAQYWQKFTPELVGTKPDGKLSLEYGPLAFLVAHKTAEELNKTNTKVDTQGEELRRVKEELNAAKGQIKELRARLGIAS